MTKSQPSMFPCLCRQGGASRKASKAAPAVSGAEAASSTLSSLLKALLPILIVLAAVYYLQLTQQAKAAA